MAPNFSSLTSLAVHFLPRLAHRIQ